MSSRSERRDLVIRAFCFSSPLKTTPERLSAFSDGVFAVLIGRVEMDPLRHRSCLGQHDDLPSRLVFLHAAVGLDDVVETEGLADLDVQLSGNDLLDQLVER